MSGSISSAFPSMNELLAPQYLNIQQQQQANANQLMPYKLQEAQQGLGANEIEYYARAAGSLLQLPDEAARAAAYPGAVAELKRYGLARNAPEQYPGEAALRRIQQMGVSSADQYKLGANAQTNASLLGSRGPASGGGAPGGGTTVAAPASDIEPDALTRAYAVRDGLIKRGMDPETATAFAANSLHESSANPNVGRGDGGASAGLFQWRDDRERAYIAKYGHSPQNAPLDEQLDFVMHELGGSESLARGRIASAQGVADKAAQVSEAYLRPKDTVAEMQRRSATALKLAERGLPQPVTGPMSDTAWLDNQSRMYPGLAGPNAPPAPPPRGVAARTGGTDVAGPPSVVPQNQVGPQIPPAPQPQTTQQPQPAAPATATPRPQPPDPVDSQGLTKRDHDALDPLVRSLTPAQMAERIEQRQQANTTLARQYQADVRQWENDQYTRQKDAAAATRDDKRLEVDIARYNADRVKDAQQMAPTLDRIAPKILDDTATADERREYSRAMETGFLKPHLELINGSQVSVPGRIPAGYPAWDYHPPKPGDTTPQPQSESEKPKVIAEAPPKEPPAKVAETLIEDANGIRKIDQTLDALAKHEGAVGPVYHIPLSQTLGDWRSPDSAGVRGLIADIGSLKLHDRSGAAISATEWPRLRPFIPSVTDTPSVIREKLQNFQREYLGILKDTYEIYGPVAGYRKLQPVEDALSRQRPQQTEQKTPAPPAGFKVIQ